jgi:phytoene synthase
MPPALPHATAADRAAAAEMIREGSKSFHAASLVLPRRVREPAYALYAFCRLADDAVDLGTDPHAAERLLTRLDWIYAGHPAGHAADRAFADTVRAHAIPRALPAALIEGLAWDTQGRRYHTLADLEDYAARVAGTVGAMMTLIMGRRDAATLARATDLGTAMQLSNIARDIGEDARAGRIYLPLEWFAEEGLEPGAFLADPRPSPATARMTARLLDRAETLYDRARPGIAALPADCRPAIAAARLLYREIGRTVAARGHDGITARAVVGPRRKAALVARALAATPMPGLRPADGPALPANRFLVEAVEAAMLPGGEARRGIGVARALDIFVTASMHDRAPRRLARS